MGRLFGTDGIRGEVNRFPMDGITAFQFGQALTHILRQGKPTPQIIIGKDTRNSGYMLERSLEAGIASMGGTSHNVGVVPTPAIAYIAKDMGFNAGIVISASHNPYHDNGLKTFNSDGFKLSDAQENEIEELILNDRLKENTPHPKAIG